MFPSWANGFIIWDIWQDGEPNRISGKLTDGYETMIVSLQQSYADSKRNIFKNGSPIVSGESFRTEITGPFSFPPSDNHHKTNPECLVGEMIFVRGDQSVDDRKAIEGYLSHKWKMSDLLPESHPYAEQDLHIDQNGQITINRAFDYENDASEFFIRVRATDLSTGAEYCSGYIG